MSTATQPHRRRTQQSPTAPAPNSSSIAAATIPLFALGVVLLICCALAITHLSKWADDHGQIPVFFAFFITMSLAGRWFWSGIDAGLTQLRDL